MKKLKELLAEIDDNFKTEYGIALSIMPYASYYDRDSLIIEIERRSRFFEEDITRLNSLIKNTTTELDDIYNNQMQKQYGQNKDLKYKYNESNLGFRILEDAYRGACLINSLHSHEYLDMKNKNFGTRVTSILKSMNSMFIINDAYDERSFQRISNKETENLVKHKRNKYKDNVADYENLVKYWKDQVEVSDELINEDQIRNIEINVSSETNNLKQKKDDLIDLLDNEFISSKNINTTKINNISTVADLTIKESKQQLRLLAKILAFKKLGEKQIYNENALNEMYVELEKRFSPEISKFTRKFNDGEQLFKTYVSDTYDVYEIFEKKYGDKNFIQPTGFDSDDFLRKVSKGFLLTKSINSKNAKEDLNKVLNYCVPIIEIKYPRIKIDKDNVDKIMVEELSVFEGKIKNKKEDVLRDVIKKVETHKNKPDDLYIDTLRWLRNKVNNLKNTVVEKVKTTMPEIKKFFKMK